MKLTIAVAVVTLSATALQVRGQEVRLPYVIVGTGQTKCYDSQREIEPPMPGQPFYGQDAQYRTSQPSYQLSSDGLTVHDNNTGLTWQRSPDSNGDGAINHSHKLSWQQAEALPARLNAGKFGGYNDWRLPTIKELYSLIVFSGVDPSGPEMESNFRTPFIDTKYFEFAYGDTNEGERIIDAQYASSTKYVGRSFPGSDKLFGVNFADGRIKGYDLVMPVGGVEKTFFVICVRGNPQYGRNDFHDNGDGTVTDRATGLMWAVFDSGKAMNWESALAWVQAKNKEKYRGHSDWRLPNAKELQSIVDYSRSPDTTGSAAIDPLFDCTTITNEIGKADYPYYWTSTTHASIGGGSNAVYIAFGRAAGWPTGRPGRGNQGNGVAGMGGPPESGPGMGGPPPWGRMGAGARGGQFVDVHGAGAQRSDPKTGDPRAFPHGRGPQGDVIRIYNYVRLVRDAK